MSVVVGSVTAHPTMSFSRDIGLRTIRAEARGEPLEGQKAVAHVIWNRLKSGRWGKSLASVCLWTLQFSCWWPSDPNLKEMISLPDDHPEWEKFGAILDAAETEPDPVNGATHYFSDTMIKPPQWSIGATFVTKIGHHQFYRDVK